ncbi:hypothetical protein EQG63_06980 [Flavobacterium amnicola]|uniref:Uncharacterized protein n=1 Tax=Flavobacterium amnicola TaxID=2506422 RepID=A0A4Q1K301_9FLAO|nr:hypothetical protein [Flavobacterium amnicola]RXR19184.1 hypothetical protein EQG63_06980 [Flavobacterium amnicola]
MDTSKIIEIAAYTIPSLITGGVAYYLFTAYFKDQQNTRRWLLQKENQKEALPLRLQAYERMAIFLERINPSKLLIRVEPMSQDKNLYEAFVIDHIEQEFEHNLAQQIYITEDCWNVILTAKNTLIQNIRKTAMNEKVTSADKLRETILSDLMEQESPTSIALSYLKKEVTQVI